MKTINIRISNSCMSHTLKIIHQNELSHTYLGADQNFNMLMQIKYETKQEEIIIELLATIEDTEDFVSHIANAFNTEFEKSTKKAA